MPAGGTGCTVKCDVVSGEERKLSWCSLLAKHTSTMEISKRGTTPTAEEGREERVSNNQLSLKSAGSGTKVEYQEEDGGKQTGTEYCSNFTAHSVGSAEDDFFQATWAQVQLVAMVKHRRW